MQVQKQHRTHTHFYTRQHRTPPFPFFPLSSCIITVNCTSGIDKLRPQTKPIKRCSALFSRRINTCILYSLCHMTNRHLHRFLIVFFFYYSYSLWFVAYTICDLVNVVVAAVIVVFFTKINSHSELPTYQRCSFLLYKTNRLNLAS